MTQFHWPIQLLVDAEQEEVYGGGITVVLYLLTSISCWITARKLSPAYAQLLRERHAWLAIAVLFLLLGINKQLDLQSALIEIGRILAHSEGWYRERRFVQAAFIGFVAMVCVFATIILLIWARHTPGPTRLALLGTVFVFGFVLIRASSFYQMDRLGFRWKWALEMGGISLTLIASVWRRKRETKLAA